MTPETKGQGTTEMAMKGSQENPWTLQEVVHLLSDSADLLHGASKIMRASTPPPPEVLKMAKARAEKAASTLWAIEGEEMTPELRKLWSGGTENQFPHGTLFLTPLVVVALDHAIQHPDNPEFALDYPEPHLKKLAPAWRWAEHGLSDASRHLRAWIEAVRAEEAS